MNRFLLKFFLVLFMLCFFFQYGWSQEKTSLINFTEHRFLPFYEWRKTNEPELFNGNKKNRNYFEGWYFKMVSADGASILSVIPGISISADGREQHAFIQFIDGKTADTYYQSFRVEDFSFSPKYFAVSIGDNYFSADSLQLKMSNDSFSASGHIEMTGRTEWPQKTILNPGIMGWYKFVPFMQCYHGVVSLTHRLQGTINLNGKSYCFDNGKGYIEKDWGSSMPTAWIWMQSNHFTDPSSSFMLSVAHIPWLGKSFTGFLGFFLSQNTLYQFATYTRASLKIEDLPNNTIRITVLEKKYSIEITAVQSKEGLLKAPLQGSMDRRIPESIDASVKLIIKDKEGKQIYSDSTKIAGLEIVGDQGLLRE